MSRRAVVWAAVSSRPQTERDSIEQQVADGAALAAAQGWQVVATLVVPGESRDYIDLADALSGLDERLRPGEENAYRRLLELLAGRAFDVLVCRARDRLGRTDALIAGVEERCRRAGVMVWSIAMPPSGSEAGDLYVSAVERAGAQREMVELRRRHRYGMDAKLKRGELLGATVPFGYRAEHVQLGHSLVRRAVVEPAEAGAYQELAAATLARTATGVELLARLRVQFPGLHWSAGTLSGLLRNPFHVGLLLRRRQANPGESASLRIFQPDGASLFDDPGWPEAQAILATRSGRGGWVNTDKRGRQKVYLLAMGEHEPVIDFPGWLALQREMESRSGTRRPHAVASLWAGMARCGLCGSLMHFVSSGTIKNPRYLYFYYRCSRRDQRYGDCDNETIRIEALTAGVVAELNDFYRQLSTSDGTPAPARPDLLAGILAQRDDLLAQRERLETLAVSGRISLETFDRRAALLSEALAGVEGRLASEQAALASRERTAVRLATLQELLPDLASRLLAAVPLEANRWLREAIEAVEVTHGRVTAVRLRV